MNDIKIINDFYCQKVLPLVYDESLSYYEMLCKLRYSINEVIKNQNIIIDYFKQFKKYVDEKLKEYVNDQMQEWLDDGTLADLINIDIINNLRDDLTKMIEDVTYYITPEQFNAKGDGITDDTQSFKDMAEASKGKNTVINMNGSYLLTDKINFDSNTIIQGNNSKIIWNNTTKIIQDGIDNDGIFTFKGNRSGVITQISSYETTYVPSQYGKWVVSNSNGFSEGDYVEIDCQNGYPKPSTFDDALPFVNILAKIVNISGNIIYTDYFTPFDISTLPFGTTTTMVKVNVVQNVQVNNLEIKVITPWENDNTKIPYLASGVYFKYCSNVTVNNIKTDRIQYPSIFLYYVNTFSITNVATNKPSFTLSGQGYSVKIVGSCFGTVDRIRGLNCRHIVDFSRGSCFITVSDSHSDWAYNDTFSNDFDLHGNYEHNITFRKCIGQFIAGNGLSNFPCITGYINFIECNFITSLGNVYKLNVTNSTIIAKNFDDNSFRQMNVKLIDSTLLIGRSFKFIATSRGGNFDTSFIIDNCKIKNYLPEHSETSTTDFDNFETFIISNSTVDYKTANRRMIVRNFNIMKLVNNTIIGAVIEPSKNVLYEPETIITYDNNIFMYSDEDSITLTHISIFRHTNLRLNKYVFKITNNTVIVNSNTPLKYALLNTTDILTSNLLLIFANNTLKTEANTSVVVNCSTIGEGLTFCSYNFILEGNINNFDGLKEKTKNVFNNGVWE